VADERIRIEIGFTGGQTIGAVVRPEAFDALRAALGTSEGVHELESDDGTYLVPARNVSFVKRWSRESKIGFGGTDSP
jgi:hypothetical protein